MGKRKPPAPRGYDPGGFRFPGSTPFFQPTERFDETRPEQVATVVEVPARHANSLAAAGVIFAAAIARGLRGRRG